MNGRRILLLVESAKRSPAALAAALDEAQGGELLAVAVLDREMLRRAHGRFGEASILGEDQTRAILDALMADHRARIEDQLAEITRASRDAGVACTAWLEEGDVVQTSLELIREHQPDLVVSPGRRPSLASRLLRETHLETIEAKASCPIRYVGD